MKKTLTASVIISEKTRLIAAYKINGVTYIFADHKDNMRVQYYENPTKIINSKTDINLIYKFSTETKEKFLVGFYICNVVYVKDKYGPSILDSPQIYSEKGYLIVKEFLYANQYENIDLNLKNAVEKISDSLLQEKEQQQVKYNKDNIYELHLVLNKIGTAAITCTIEGKKFVLVEHLKAESEKKILDLNVGSKINIKVLNCENNIVSFILFDTIFVKAAYCNKDQYDEVILRKPNCDAVGCVVGVENKIKRTTPATEVADPIKHTLEETTSQAYSVSKHTNPAGAVITYIPLLYEQPTEATRLINSSAESLKELNSKHCNIL